MRLDSGLPWRRVAALFEIGPGFGTAPAWFANDTLRALHTMRGMAPISPNARVHLLLAQLELLERNRAGAEAAWRTASRIDPPGVAMLLSRFGEDTLRMVMNEQPLAPPASGSYTRAP